MELRKVGSLVQLGDKELFEEIALGLRLLFQHASQLHADANTLRGRGNKSHGAVLLHSLAEEEAAKFLILLDAVRCPKQALGLHLRKFYDHLARCLYAEAYGAIATGLGSDSFGALKQHLEQEKMSYYLDELGVVRNLHLFARETAYYVDFVEETGGVRHWMDPLGWWFTGPPMAFKMVKSMVDVGLTTIPAALAVIAGVWRGVAIEDDMRWMDRDRLNQETLEILKEQSLLQDQPQEVYEHIIRGWQFPLYGIDLNEDKAGGKDLRRRLKDHEKSVPNGC